MSENTNTTESKKAPTDYGKVCESEAALKEVTKPERGEAYQVILFAGDAPRWCYADGYIQAYARVAKERGGSCTKAGKAIPKDQLAAGLAALSAEDRAALIAAYLPAPAPTGKGKK